MNPLTSTGNVAENIMICTSGGQNYKILIIRGWKSTESSLSASSNMKCFNLDKSANFLCAKSSILPGVPTRT